MSVTINRDFSERHREILLAAMELIVERGGTAGASLRALARRVNVSQPSLYTYFDSKAEIVGQILDWYTDEVITDHVSALGELDEVPQSIRGLLRLVMQRIAATWRRPEHVVFVKFLFIVSMEDPTLGGLIYEVFLQRAREMTQAMLAPRVDGGELLEDDVDLAVTTCINAVVMEFMQEKVLNIPVQEDRDVDEFIEFLADVVSSGVRARRARHADEEAT